MATIKVLSFYDDADWSGSASVIVGGTLSPIVIGGTSTNYYTVTGGTSSFDFAIRNSANKSVSATARVTGNLVSYGGETVGVFHAYAEKVSIDGGTAKTYYLNGRGTISGGTVSWSDNADRTIEYVTAGNLTFTIERNYTDIDRDAYYVVRSVADTGAESPPSDISALVTRHPDEKAFFTFSIDKAVVDKDHLTAFRLYRASGGTSGSDFLFVKEFPLSGGTLTGGSIYQFTVDDALADAELNEAMPKYGSVPDNLSGIVGMSGGFIAAWKGKDLFFSEPYQPNCFPWEYNQSVPFDIVGVAVRSNYLYVMTTGQLYAFVGDAPENIVPLAMRFDVPCISRASIAHVRGSIIYAGTTGLVIIDNGGPAIFSDKLYSIEQYKAIHFENCRCAGEYDGKYFAVFDDRTLLFDFSDGGLKHTLLDTTALTGGTFGTYTYNDGSWENNSTAGHNAPYGETRISQDFTASAAVAVWKSKEYVFERPVAFSCARVRYDAPDTAVTLKLYAEGAPVCTVNARHNEAFRLPVLRRECRWSAEVSGTADVTSIELAESMSEM